MTTNMEQLDIDICWAAINAFTGARDSLIAHNNAQGGVMNEMNAMTYHVHYAEMIVAMAVMGASEKSPSFLNDSLEEFMGSAETLVETVREPLSKIVDVVPPTVIEYDDTQPYAVNVARDVLADAIAKTGRVHGNDPERTMAQDSVMAGFAASSAKSLEILIPTFTVAEVYAMAGYDLVEVEEAMKSCSAANDQFLKGAWRRQAMIAQTRGQRPS